MTHDLLCYANSDCEGNENYLCDLIAIVRNDMATQFLVQEREVLEAYDAGQRDAINAAVQRVEALRYGPEEMYEVADMYHAALAAIKGEVNA